MRLLQIEPAIVRDIFARIGWYLGTSRTEVIKKLLITATIWLVAWIAYQIVRRIAKRILASVDDGDDSTMTSAEKRGHTVAQLVRSLGRAVILVIALLVTLAQYVDIGPILAGAGILGLAVSFGAQSLVKDIIAGFFILVENQFAVGDVIEVAGKSGTVERMTLRIVMLRDLRGVLHVVPNGQITTVSNLTRTWSRAVVDVGVGYDSDLDRVLGVLRDELTRFQADPHWKGRFEGESSVSGAEQLGEHAVILRTLLRTVPGAQWEVAREFRRRVKNRFDAEHIEIPFPQRTVHVRHSGDGRDSSEEL